MAKRSKVFAEPGMLIDGASSVLGAVAGDRGTERLIADARSSCQADWTILRRASINGLIVGPLDLTAAAVAGIAGNLRQPVVHWDSSQTSAPPELTGGTLVIRDVDRLDPGQQDRLLRWMRRRCPAVQVLVVARTPLFAEVVHGRFSAELYYRMNTVIVEVRAPLDLPSVF